MRKSQEKEKKNLSSKSLLEKLKKIFDEVTLPVKDPRGRKKTISLSDCLMSALAVFGIKSPSLLAFDTNKKDERVIHNLKSLYNVKDVPSDTYMREVLDEIDPKELRKAFLVLFQTLQREKILENYQFLGSYLTPLDGSEIFNSEKVFCENCCKKEHRDGRTTYHHQILSGVLCSPYIKQVLPFCPEPIIKKDGMKKNDCERNASFRFLENLKKEHPKLKITVAADALYANSPFINKLLSIDYNFIIRVKSSGNKSLFEWLNGIDLQEETVKVDKNEYHFRFMNNIPLNDTKNAPEVNFLECEAVEQKGKKIKKTKFYWVTNHKIEKSNLYQLMLGGRARWKVENETFNTLKNQGYQFEHNFGHGNKNLHTVFSFMMMLAFFVDQIQELTSGLVQKAIKNKKTKKMFWEKVRMLFHSHFILSWQDLFLAIGSNFKGTILVPNTS